jgi:putative SOS response-associated peptidase YedK
MPIILEADQFEPWLTARAGRELLKPAANDVLQRWPVSKRVNSSRASDDDGISPPESQVPMPVML